MKTCKACGKTDFDFADGCVDPGVFSPAVGDWFCDAAIKRPSLPATPAWQPPETAPKDRAILACFGFPWPVVALYSDANDEWVTAAVEQNLYSGESDPSFVSEYFSEAELLGWMEMPEALMPKHLLPRLTLPSDER